MTIFPSGNGVKVTSEVFQPTKESLLTPSIISRQYTERCSVNWGYHEYSGGYHEYTDTGGSSVHLGIP